MQNSPTFRDFQELVSRLLLYTSDEENFFKCQAQGGIETYIKTKENEQKLEEIVKKIDDVKLLQQDIDKYVEEIAQTQTELEKIIDRIEKKQQNVTIYDTNSQRAQMYDLLQKLFVDIHFLKNDAEFLVNEKENANQDGLKETLNAIAQTIACHFRCCELIHAKTAAIKDQLETVGMI